MFVSKACESLDLGQRVDCTHLSRLRDRDHASLHVMLIPDPLEEWFNCLWTDFPVLGRHSQQLTPSKIFRSAAFVTIYMRLLGTTDRLIRLCDCFQRQHVRAGSAKDKIDIDLLPKVLAKPRDGSSGVLIVAISDHVSDVVRFFNRIQDCGMHARIVIARKASLRLYSSRHSPSLPFQESDVSSLRIVSQQ